MKNPTNKEIMSKLIFLEEMIYSLIMHFNVPRNNTQQGSDDPARKFDESESEPAVLIADSSGYVNLEYEREFMIPEMVKEQKEKELQEMLKNKNKNNK